MTPPPATSVSGISGTAPVDGSRPSTTASSGLLLHRWRRLDWRYLVPSVGWARVGCGGAVDEELRSALPLLGADVHEVSSAAGWLGLAGTCDLVVLVDPSRAELASAVAAARPGGWVYAEVRRGSPGKRGRSLVGWRRALRREGLEQVSAHWHAPDPRSAEQIVPLASRPALRQALLRNRGSRAGFRNTVGRVLLAAGLFPLVVPAGSVVGRRPVDAA